MTQTNPIFVSGTITNKSNNYIQQLLKLKEYLESDDEMVNYVTTTSCDKKTREYLGHQLLEEIDSDIEMGYGGFTYETITQNLKLKSGFKEILVEASEDEPLEVEVFYNFACGKSKK